MFPDIASASCSAASGILPTVSLARRCACFRFQAQYTMDFHQTFNTNLKQSFRIVANVCMQTVSEFVPDCSVTCVAALSDRQKSALSMSQHSCQHWHRQHLQLRGERLMPVSVPPTSCAQWRDSAFHVSWRSLTLTHGATACSPRQPLKK